MLFKCQSCKEETLTVTKDSSGGQLRGYRGTCSNCGKTGYCSIYLSGSYPDLYLTHSSFKRKGINDFELFGDVQCSVYFN
jgi:hypothetical protein